MRARRRNPIRSRARQSVSEYRWDIEELLDAGDCVLGLCRFSSRMDSEGRWISPPLGAVFSMREGKVVRVCTYFSWSEARQAAGLEETGQSSPAS